MNVSSSDAHRPEESRMVIFQRPNTSLPKNGSPADAALLKMILPLVGGAFAPGKLAQE